MEKFFDYFDDRYRESVLNKPPADDGPVITISRQTGCDAREIAANVVDGKCAKEWQDGRHRGRLRQNSGFVKVHQLEV